MTKGGDLGLQVWNEANLWAVSQEMKSESCTAQELPLKAPERAKVSDDDKALVGPHRETLSPF
jgi:hypothetical protein